MKTNMPDGLKGVMGWTLGVGIIAFILLVMVIIFGNLQGNVGFGTEADAIVNESIVLSDAGATVATASGKINPVLSSVVLVNSTDGTTISSGNYTITGTSIANTTAMGGGAKNISYTITYDSQGKIDSDNIILNYTTSATNTSDQFSTVGTIVGIALLLLILISLLIFAITKMMGIMSGSTRRSNTNFSGGSRSFS